MGYKRFIEEHVDTLPTVFGGLLLAAALTVGYGVHKIKNLEHRVSEPQTEQTALEPEIPQAEQVAVQAEPTTVPVQCPRSMRIQTAGFMIPGSNDAYTMDNLSNDYKVAIANLNKEKALCAKDIGKLNTVQAKAAAGVAKNLGGMVSEGIRYNDHNVRRSTHDYRAVERMGKDAGNAIYNGMVFNNSGEAIDYLRQRTAEINEQIARLQVMYGNSLKNNKVDPALRAELEAYSLVKHSGTRGLVTRGTR